MNGPSIRMVAVALFLLVTMIVPLNLPRQVSALPAGPAIVGVWSNAKGSSNITDTTLVPNSRFTVEINVTNAGDFNAYDFFLYYDSNYLQAISVDEENNTIFSNRQLFVPAKELTPLGTVRLAVAVLGSAFTGANGTLAHIQFNVIGTGVSPLVMAAGMAKTSNYAQSYTRLTLGTAPLEVMTTDGYFKNVAGKLGPLASFTVSPASPKEGDHVTFNAAGSFDVDNDTTATRGIIKYTWDYGDGLGNNTLTPISIHTFASATSAIYFGNFSIRLTVIDSDDNFQGMKTQLVTVAQIPFHDVAIQSITPSATKVKPGTKVDISVVVFNPGTFSEIFNVTIRSLGPPPTVLGILDNQPLASRVSSPPFKATFDTTGLNPGFYTIQANVTIALDQNGSNNGQVTVVNVAEESSSAPLLYLAVGGVAVAGAVAALFLLMKRRGRKQDTE